MAPRLSSRISFLVKQVGGNTARAAEALGVSRRTVQRALQAEKQGRDFVKTPAAREKYQQAIPAARERVQTQKILRDLEKATEKKYQRKELYKEAKISPQKLARLKKDIASGKIHGKEVDKKLKELLKAAKNTEKDVVKGVLIYRSQAEFIEKFGGNEPKSVGMFASQAEAVNWVKSFGAGPQYFVVVKVVPDDPEEEPDWVVYDIRGDDKSSGAEWGSLVSSEKEGEEEEGED